MNSHKQPPNPWGDYEEPYKRLKVLAHLCSSWMPDICDGISAEDLPNQIMLMFFESPDKLGWESRKGSLERFLLGVLKHKMKDRYRRHTRIAGSLDDPDFMKKVHHTRIEKISNDELDADFLRIFKSDPELQELIAAAKDIVGGYNRNQQLAQELHTTTKAVVKLKRKLQQRLAISKRDEKR